jgi:hypothetical protein
MAARPNFTEVEIDGDTVQVHGVSDPSEVADIVDIRVILAQGRRVAGGPVEKPGSPWVANLPVRDPEGASADFQVGEVLAFGVETHRENLLTITWAQMLQIGQRRQS